MKIFNKAKLWVIKHITVELIKKDMYTVNQIEW